jgi:hypothetical protein
LKLLKHDPHALTFLVGKRERDMLSALLLRYPVLSSAHYRKRHPAGSTEAGVDDDLLRDALSDQQKETRRHLEEWLKSEGRFQETDLGYSFSLTLAELEWMLQILNDIRVGSWVQLGEPDGKSPPKIEMTESTVQLAWALEMAGLFQHHLLEAVQTPE